VGEKHWLRMDVYRFLHTTRDKIHKGLKTKIRRLYAKEKTVAYLHTTFLTIINERTVNILLFYCLNVLYFLQMLITY
jgi:hypothetical protein